jgi:hypothetical protein
MVYPKPLATITLIGSALVALAVLTTSGAASPRPAAASAVGGPVVVELYHSQGCSSCPPAEADLNVLAQRADVLALSFGVTYWDRLGWKDTFASERFTARQIDYARAGKGEVATPEFIVNGALTVVGADRRALDAAIANAGAPAGGPSISVDHATLRVAGAPAGGTPATVWLVRYDPRTLQVPVRAGENSGRTLAHRNIVRELVDLGRWTGAATTFALPVAHEAGLSSAVLVQRGPGGPIVASRRI